LFDIQYTPTLRVYRFIAGQTSLVGTASIHAIHVYSRDADGADWASSSIPDDDRYGSETKLERKTDNGVGANSQVRLVVKDQGTCRARLSPDGHPQNEYWLKSDDAGDLPQPYVFKPGATQKTWVQGYGDPSPTTDNLSLRISPSLSYQDETTPAPFTTVRLKIGVDANRDHQITFDEADRATRLSPYRFWVNDNHDAIHTDNPGGYSEEDTIPGAPDGAGTIITCRRDLEDYTRLWVLASNRAAIGSRLRADDVELSFTVKRIASEPAPSIRVFLSADPAGSLKYLTEYENVAALQGHTHPNGPSDNYRFTRAAAVVPAGGTTTLTIPAASDQNSPLGISRKFAGALSPDGQAPDATSVLAPFLFDGATPGRGEVVIKLSAVLDGKRITIGRGRVVVDLRKITQFYEQWTYGDQPMTFEPGTETRPNHFPGSLIYDDQDNYFPEKSYLLFVHGWNMGAFDKAAFSATAYKRLWWNGYKGRFGAVRWPTKNDFGSWYDPLLEPQHYDDSEYIAWWTGERLAKWLPELSQRNQCSIDLLGHSMGNIVVGSALRVLSNGQVGAVGTYVATQAAVPARLYDATGASCRPWSPSLLGYEHWNTADVYRTGLLEVVANTFKMVNFTNENDFALAEGASGVNQLTKPDAGMGSYLTGPNGIEAGELEFRDRFFRRTFQRTDPFDRLSPEYVHVFMWSGNALSAETEANYERKSWIPTHYIPKPGSHYHIMAYLSESRHYPLGATPQLSTVFDSVSLNVDAVWPRLKPDDIANGRYSSHRWHSGQFRMTMPEQKEYWKTLMRRCNYPSVHHLP